LDESFWAIFISRETAFSRVLKSFLTVEKRPISCWSFALNSVILLGRPESSPPGAAVEMTTGAATSTEAATTGATSTLGAETFLVRGALTATSTAGVTETGAVDLTDLTILAIIIT